jgi:hypothetical protein
LCQLYKKSNFVSDKQDYIIPNYSIVFSGWSVPGARRWCFPIYILDDNILEDSETLMLQLVSTSSLVVVDPNNAITTITITEDDRDCKFIFENHFGV